MIPPTKHAPEIQLVIEESWDKKMMYVVFAAHRPSHVPDKTQPN